MPVHCVDLLTDCPSSMIGLVQGFASTAHIARPVSASGSALGGQTAPLQPQALPEPQTAVGLGQTILPDSSGLQPASNIASMSAAPDNDQLRRRSRSGSLSREQLSATTAAKIVAVPEPASTEEVAGNPEGMHCSRCTTPCCPPPPFPPCLMCLISNLLLYVVCGCMPHLAHIPETALVYQYRLNAAQPVSIRLIVLCSVSRDSLMNVWFVHRTPFKYRD